MTLTDTCRISGDDLNITPFEIISTLTGNNMGSMSVMMQWLNKDPMALVFFLTSIDLKHLYDEHIWEVYKLCGKDLNRFIYHVEMELPNQATGQLGFSGPYSHLADDDFCAKRTFGKPGSYWALEHPPVDPNYEYPIR